MCRFYQVYITLNEIFLTDFGVIIIHMWIFSHFSSSTTVNDRFDRLCELVGCEKIATLGDCYYCVSGCPNPTEDHAERTVEMGRAMCLAIQQFDEDHSEEVSERIYIYIYSLILVSQVVC